MAPARRRLVRASVADYSKANGCHREDPGLPGDVAISGIAGLPQKIISHGFARDGTLKFWRN